MGLLIPSAKPSRETGFLNLVEIHKNQTISELFVQKKLLTQSEWASPFPTDTARHCTIQRLAGMNQPLRRGTAISPTGLFLIDDITLQWMGTKNWDAMKRPNRFIIPQLFHSVNILLGKNPTFSLLSKKNETIMWKIPSCKKGFYQLWWSYKKERVKDGDSSKSAEREV